MISIRRKQQKQTDDDYQQNIKNENNRDKSDNDIY